MTDNLTPEQRSYCMSRVKNRDTDIEQRLRSGLHKRGLRFRKHVKDIPGKPDIVFPAARVAVFIDGDFWHGYRFPAWEHTLSEFWKQKIRKNRDRDQKNFNMLRKSGWRVLRIWQNQVESNVDECIKRIGRAVKSHAKRRKGRYE